MIVVNTTVLSNLAEADRLSLLETLFGRVLVPSQVHDEILKGIAAGYDFLKAVDESTEAEWIVLTTFENQPERTLFKRLLGTRCAICRKYVCPSLIARKELRCRPKLDLGPIRLDGEASAIVR